MQQAICKESLLEYGWAVWDCSIFIMWRRATAWMREVSSRIFCLKLKHAAAAADVAPVTSRRPATGLSLASGLHAFLCPRHSATAARWPNQPAAGCSITILRMRKPSLCGITSAEYAAAALSKLRLRMHG